VSDSDRLLADQIDYYRARAPEYDDWWFRRGPYDKGPEFTRRWRKEIDELESALDSFMPKGDVLEIAAGTGAWTKVLAQYASSVTAIDAAPETLEINRDKVAGIRIPIRYIEHDIFTWEPDRQYDVAFFGFWLTHVPHSQFESFWDLVRVALAPKGRFFFVDSAHPEGEARPEVRDGLSLRQLQDGREFQIVKQFWRPEDLQARLAALGWDSEIRTTQTWFIYGHGSRASSID
jgi:ubiquinone/menaquinone biosynthesis C-methylase UbiE